MEDNDMTLNELLRQIDSYFECELSDAEEKELRYMLAVTTLEHPAIDEARAVMGLCRSEPIVRSGIRYGILVAAASVILLISLGMAVMLKPWTATEAENVCIAYVGGQCITDENAVFELLARDVSGVSMSDEMLEFKHEMSEAADIIDSYESIDSDL